MKEELKLKLNTNQRLLKEKLLKPECFEEARSLCLMQHSMMHSSIMSPINEVTLLDELLMGLDDYAIKTATNEKGRTIAYGLWHSTRIEDITMNILVSDDTQVFHRDNWISTINSPICDTGNQLSSEQILEFSKNINVEQLLNYRLAVGRRSQNIIKALNFKDLKRKFSKEVIDRILLEKAVADVPEANWLIDFWSRKNVAGILLMPVTRHHIVHINESFKAKNKYLKTLGANNELC